MSQKISTQNLFQNFSPPETFFFHRIIFSHIFLRPSRVTQVMEGLKTLQNHYPDHMEFVTDIDPVDRKLLNSVHDLNYLTKMENQVPKIFPAFLTSQTPDSDDPRHATQFSMNDERGAEDCDTFMSHFSFNAALTAAGAVCKAVDLVMAGKYRNAFCCVRPPGHHCGIKVKKSFEERKKKC